MSLKGTIVRRLVGLTDEWNSEIHNAIEQRVIAEHSQLFPPRPDDDNDKRQKRIEDMRAFYYARMSTTASLLLAGAALIVALAALVGAVIPLFK